MGVELTGLCVGGPCDGETRSHWGATVTLVALTPFTVIGAPASVPDLTEHVYKWDDGTWRYEGAA
jgi:hypothetical protein